MVRSGEEWWAVVVNGEHWLAMVKYGEQWWAMVRNDEQVGEILNNENLGTLIFIIDMYLYNLYQKFTFIMFSIIQKIHGICICNHNNQI